jgi:hypothetical protein
MWLVIEKSDCNCWISGVFLQLVDAEQYLSILPLDHLEGTELREISANEYPILLIHDFEMQDLIYVTLDELVDRLWAVERLHDDDHQYFMYFVFQEDYRGYTHEEEYYAFANHHHVDNRYLYHFPKLKS